MIFIGAAVTHPSLGRAHVEPDGFFYCEFCRCYTNAELRACCDAGRDADRAASKARRALRVSGAADGGNG